MAISQRTAKKRRGSVYKNEEICGTIMASLPVIRFILFGLAPMVLALVMAFFKMKKITSFEGAEFVWFENFKYIFTDPNFGTSIVNTLIYVLVLPVSIFLGLLIAAVLNSKVRGKGFFRVVVFLPYICSTVAIVYIWKWLYNYNYGIFNVLLGRQIPWLIDKNMFRLSILMMLLWSTTGYKIIILAAGLTAVNSSYYEAAEIDGANALQKFAHITVPAISPTLFFLLVTGMISIFQMFSESQVMDPTGGQSAEYAGLTIVFYLYRMGFNYYDMGAASATAWVLSLMILAITVLNFKISKLWVHYD